MDLNTILLELYNDCMEKNVNNIYETISFVLNSDYGIQLSSEAVRSRIRRASKTINEKPFVNEDKKQCLTLDSALEDLGCNPDDFEFENIKVGAWDSNNGVKSSYRFTVKPKKKDFLDEDSIKRIFDKIKITPFESHYLKEDFISEKSLVLPIVDLHYGMLNSLGNDSNSYNRLNAKQIFNYVVKNVTDRTQDIFFEKVYFIIGNDMLNVDNKQKTTTKGTPQDTDGFIENHIVEVTNLLLGAIEYLRNLPNIKEIEIINVPGNHDNLTSFGISNTLRVLYDGCNDVSVDYENRPRKYKVFGNTLLGFSHDLNVKNVNDIIQADARSLLADTTNTVYFLAHLHHEYALDKSGTDVRRLPTVSALSNWSFENGYSSRRKCQSFIIEKLYGITDILYTVI